MYLNSRNLSGYNPNASRSRDVSKQNTQKPGAYLSFQPQILKKEILGIFTLKHNPKSSHQEALKRFTTNSGIPGDLKTMGDWILFSLHYGEAKAEKCEKKSTDMFASKSQNLAMAADARGFSKTMESVLDALEHRYIHLAKEALLPFTDTNILLKIENPAIPEKHRHMLSEMREICVSLRGAMEDDASSETGERRIGDALDASSNLWENLSDLTADSVESSSDISDLTDDEKSAS